MATSPRTPVRLHLTNVTGIGAVQLARSLLPKLEEHPDYRLETLYMPDRGDLAAYAPATDATLIRYRRRLPNAMSRLIECTLLGGRFDGGTPLLVLGDVPIRCASRQTVFVQTRLLTASPNRASRRGALKYKIGRALFRRNARYASAFVVQTHAMKSALVDTYPEVRGRVHVVGQPPPTWLIDAQVARSGPIGDTSLGLRLFYPAAAYPHKNHRLLSAVAPHDTAAWPVSSLTLTIDQQQSPNRDLSWLRCVGSLTSGEVIDEYRRADALLFLSKEESFGFPLAEAMHVGLPVICPDLPYSRELCGSDGIFFDPDSIVSLNRAVVALRQRLDSGWWPNWSHQLGKLPRNWDDVAEALLRIATASKLSDDQ